jgi:predicted AlkP superfamily pyrophosphatase or phosphodiesterase
LRPLRSLRPLLLIPALPLVPARAQTPPPPRTSGPTLVVMITVDQFRPDYLRLFQHQLQGGLARLYRGGAVFLEGFQDHAITETAPGHASVLSGRFPRSTGIVSNAAGVADPQSPLLGARGEGASPFRFRGTVLIDWMRYTYPAARALSVSRKDRGAILPIGRAKQQAYWYPGSGGFTTSTHYADTLPTWVKAFNARKLPQQWAGKSWDLLLDRSQYQELDSVRMESGGRDYVFPHAISGDSAQAAAMIAGMPMMDELTLQFALEGLRQLQLGTGPHPDLLAISLSAMDAVGHRFGPDSRELHDMVLRLDRYLGAFFDSLFALRDSTKIVVALTSDHGVAPFPEVRSRDNNRGAGRVDLAPFAASLATSLREAGVDRTALTFDEAILQIDAAAIARQRMNADAVVRLFTQEALKVPGVLRVDRVRDLATKDTTTDYVARRWLHMLPADLPAAAVVTLRPYWYWGNITYATHGTPHDYDAKVPIIFYGAGVKPGQYQQRALVVDIAPTLAGILGIRPLERLDGRALQAALRN